MTATPRQLNALRDEIHLNARVKGFWDRFDPDALQRLGRLFTVVRVQVLEAERIRSGVDPDDARYVEAYQAAVALSEHPPNNPAQLESLGRLMLLVTEAVEAGDAYLAGNRRALAIELADTAIRAFDLAGGWRLDIGTAIHEKMAINAERPELRGKRTQ